MRSFPSTLFALSVALSLLSPLSEAASSHHRRRTLRGRSYSARLRSHRLRHHDPRQVELNLQVEVGSPAEDSPTRTTTTAAAAGSSTDSQAPDIDSSLLIGLGSGAIGQILGYSDPAGGTAGFAGLVPLAQQENTASSTSAPPIFQASSSDFPRLVFSSGQRLSPNPKFTMSSTTTTSSVKTTKTTGAQTRTVTTTSGAVITSVMGTTAVRTAGPPATTTARTTGTAAPTGSPSGPIQGYFYGANSYYLFAIAQSDRLQILDAIASAGMKTIRIFITSIYSYNKGSNVPSAVPDLEPDQVGTYDDTILNLIDQLMVDASSRGLKLVIALGDRYALGFWSTDAYALQFGIVGEGSSGVQQVADASAFYLEEGAVKAFDKRIKHILNHKNQKMGGKRWAELGEAIYAFEPQNEPMGHMDLVSDSWNCDRASTIASMIQGSGILISTGGGITLDTSLADWAFNCPHFDIISVHDYGTTPSYTVPQLQSAQKRASSSGKIVLFEEWGGKGDNKAGIIKSFVSMLKSARIPWMYWEVVKPGKGANDFEVWTDEPSFQQLANGGIGGSGSSSTSSTDGNDNDDGDDGGDGDDGDDGDWNSKRDLSHILGQSPYTLSDNSTSAGTNNGTVNAGSEQAMASIDRNSTLQSQKSVGRGQSQFHHRRFGWTLGLRAKVGSTHRAASRGPSELERHRSPAKLGAWKKTIAGRISS